MEIVRKPSKSTPDRSDAIFIDGRFFGNIERDVPDKDMHCLSVFYFGTAQGSELIQLTVFVRTENENAIIKKLAMLEARPF